MKSNPSEYLIEACVENYDEAVQASLRGANQVELCSHLESDGLTPHFEDIEKCLSDLNILTKVMIRPRAGDFITKSKDISLMCSEIVAVKKLGVQHIVLGLTTSEKILDIDSLRYLVETAHP